MRIGDMIAGREAYGSVLVELGMENQRIVAIDADLSESTHSDRFGQRFPDRFFNMGMAEQGMFAAAAGMATCGKIVFASTFAVFASMRACEQVRTSIAYPNLNVKIVASHGGITVGENGVTHQATEDIAIMRSIANMVVLVPADAVATVKLVREAANHNGPVYIRLARPKVPVLYDQSAEFRIGGCNLLREGNHVALVATGYTVANALHAADLLQSEGIYATVIDVYSIKPINREILMDVAREVKVVISIEDHTIVGGLGSAIAEIFAEEGIGVRLYRMGLPDIFGESGKAEDLIAKYGLTPEAIMAKAKEAVIGG